MDSTPGAYQDGGLGGRTLETLASTPAINEWMFSRFRLFMQGWVLEVGSGIGNISQFIVDCPGVTRAYLTEVEPDLVARLQQRFCKEPKVEVHQFELGGAIPAALAPGRFQSIISINVLEHVGDDQLAARQLYELLSAEGKLLVYVPACPWAYGPVDAALGHHRRYTPKTLTALLESAGFAIEQLRYMNLPGLFGWFFNGRILRKAALDPKQLALFEKLLPIIKLEDSVKLPIGLGLYAIAQRPSA